MNVGVQEPRPKARRFYLWHAGVAVMAALLLVFVFEYTDLDRAISDFFYDPALRHFPLQHDWFLEVVMHHWAKYLIVMIAVGALAGFLASFKVAALRPQRRVLLFVFLALALGPATVSTLKLILAKHCPYDLDIYGGFAPYLRLLDAPVPDVRPGQCFPGGHASGGFALMAFYFVWYRHHPQRAFAVLAAGFLYGFILGAGRLLQGAHFLSHNLWAAVVVWLVALLLYRLILHPEHFQVRGA